MCFEVSDCSLHASMHVHVLQMHGRSSGAAAGWEAIWLSLLRAGLAYAMAALQAPQRLCCMSRAGALLLGLSRLLSACVSVCVCVCIPF